MKKKIIGALATISATAGLAMSGASAFACPFASDGPCPGRCGHFIDSDGNGICDLSETTTNTATSDAATSDSYSSVDSANSAYNGDTNVDRGSMQDLGDVSTGADTNASAIQDSGIFGNNTVDPTNYHAIPLSILLIAGYLFTHFLFSRGILSRKKHRRIWNLLLTAGYVGTGFTGVLLILILNLGISSVMINSINWAHAELAILMVIGTLIHIHLYKKPFRNMFKVLFGFKSDKRSKTNSTSK